MLREKIMFAGNIFSRILHSSSPHPGHVALQGHHLCQSNSPLSVFLLFFLLSLQNTHPLSNQGSSWFPELAAPMAASSLFPRALYKPCIKWLLLLFPFSDSRCLWFTVKEVFPVVISVPRSPIASYVLNHLRVRNV